MKSIVTYSYADRYCGPAKSARPGMQFLPTRPGHRDFRRYGRPPWAGALAAGCGRPWISPPPGGIRGRLVPVPLSRMPVAPFPLPRRGLGCPSFRSFCAGQRRCRREAASGHVRAGPVTRPGAARCRLVFWPGHGSDVAGSNAAAVPPAAG
jgi:hypothetical protein